LGIVQIVLEIIFTGGSISIERLFAKSSQIINGFIKKAGSFADDVFRALDKLIVIIKKGADHFASFIRQVLDDFFEWLKGLFKSGKEFALGDEIEAILLPFIKILKENPSFINCIKLVNKNRYFQKWMAIESEAMIKLHTANTYRVLNNALREINSIKLDKELKAMQRILDEALEKLPISKYNKQLLQRSAFFTEEEISKLFKVGKDFVEKGFMSTTHSQEALERWLISNPSHNVIFKVIGKNGKLIEEASMLPFEHEVLFKSETRFVVESVKPVTHPIDRSKEVIEIILKEK
jgi:hypothetical protein